MTEQDFLRAAEAALTAIESALERAADDDDLDVEISRNDNVLTIEFDDGAKIIVNSHAAAREIWVAARSGGYHYRHDAGRWIDTRSGDELFAALSKLVGQQAGTDVQLRG